MHITPLRFGAKLIQNKSEGAITGVKLELEPGDQLPDRYASDNGVKATHVTLGFHAAPDKPDSGLPIYIEYANGVRLQVYKLDEATWGIFRQLIDNATGTLEALGLPADFKTRLLQAYQEKSK